MENVILEIPRLKKVRDLFIFSFYTGISYADIMLLTPQNLVIGMDKKIWIVTKREKNGNQVKLPLLKRAIAIIKKIKMIQTVLLIIAFYLESLIKNSIAI